jgi:hypothetical protein
MSIKIHSNTDKKIAFIILYGLIYIYIYIYIYTHAQRNIATKKHTQRIDAAYTKKAGDAQDRGSWV